MANYVDHNYFEELARSAPDTLCRNGRCRSEAGGRYALEVWGEEYIVDCGARSIARSGGIDGGPHEYFYLFVIFYLLSTADGRLTGEWISEKDLPGGATFFRGPHLIPTGLISGRFGNDLGAFRRCCESLGGTPLALGDAAFRFEIVPDIAVAVIYWQGDEDFPAEAGLLYDRSIVQLLPLDIVFALAVSICDRIGRAGRPEAA